MNCQKCGILNDDEARFCKKCGILLPEKEPPQNESLDADTESQDEPPKSRMKIYLAVIGALLAVALIVGLSVRNNIIKKPSSSTAAGETTAFIVTPEDAKNLDSAIWKEVLECEDANNKLKEAVNRTSIDRSEYDDFIKLFDDIGKYQKEKGILFDINVFPDAINIEKSRDYLDSCNAYAAQSELAAGKIAKFMNGHGVNDLKEAREHLSEADRVFEQVKLERLKFLAEYGISEPELP